MQALLRSSSSAADTRAEQKKDQRTVGEKRTQFWSDRRQREKNDIKLLVEMCVHEFIEFTDKTTQDENGEDDGNDGNDGKG